MTPLGPSFWGSRVAKYKRRIAVGGTNNYVTAVMTDVVLALKLHRKRQPKNATVFIALGLKKHVHNCTRRRSETIMENSRAEVRLTTSICTADLVFYRPSDIRYQFRKCRILYFFGVQISICSICRCEEAGNLHPRCELYGQGRLV